MSNAANHEDVADTLQMQIYSRMTPAQKWEQVCALRQLAWSLKSSMIRSQHPQWSEAQVHEAVRDIFLYATT